MSKKSPYQTLQLLFFLSGAAGLVYEIVWIRMLVLVFGNTTHSILAVVSSFLAGLALGSFFIGRRTDGLAPQTLLRFYGKLEIAIGITAAVSIPVFHSITLLYAFLSDGTSVTGGLLLVKFLLTACVLLIPTALMGGTLPTLISFAEKQYAGDGRSISLLYGVNTFGAALGVLTAAFVLLEVLGLYGSLGLAVVLNIVVGIIAFSLQAQQNGVQTHTGPKSGPKTVTSIKLFYLISYGLSGFAAIAYQILWTRILTPRTGTFVYAFASILAIYLFGIAAGSWLHNRFFNRASLQYLVFFVSQLGIGVFALCSVYATSSYFDFSILLTSLLVVLPATVFMGIAFPAAALLVNEKVNRPGDSVGLSYAANTIGSILGGIAASFVLIPTIGSTQSIMVIALINLIIALMIVWIKRKNIPSKLMLSGSFSILSMIALTVFSLNAEGPNLHERTTQKRINWLRFHNLPFEFKEDEVASVLGFKGRTSEEHGLFIDGIPTTAKVVETKMMAHLPLSLHPNPQRMLIVAFGMGTTFRSALLHNIQVDAVELCPSVPKMFSLFHNDAEEILNNPNGRIIINDGRNYVFLTKHWYDIVTIDPPPPFNAAGTTVLYSREFYEEIIKKLHPGGLVCQWMLFGSREDDVAMAIASFLKVFSHVRAFRSVGQTRGIYLIGSQSPIDLNESRLNAVFTSPAITNDLAETHAVVKPGDIKSLYVGDREILSKAYNDFPLVTDNFPRTEYFLLRHYFMDYSFMDINRLLKRIQ